MAEDRDFRIHLSHVERQIARLLGEPEPPGEPGAPPSTYRLIRRWIDRARRMLLRLRRALQNLDWCASASQLHDEYKELLEENGDRLSEEQRKEIEDRLLRLEVAIQGNCHSSFWP